jgi:hypothetical protein
MKNILGTSAAGSLIALGAIASLTWSTDTSSAQSACMSQCRDSGWSEGKCTSYCLGNQPRVYGYYRRYGYGPDAAARSAERFGGCGEYYYWNGVSCADARIDPSDRK